MVEVRGGARGIGVCGVKIEVICILLLLLTMLEVVEGGIPRRWA